MIVAEYELTPEDVVAFTRYYVERQRRAAGQTPSRTILTIVIVVCFGGLMALDAFMAAGAQTLIIVLACVLGVGLLYLMMARAEGPLAESRIRGLFRSKEGAKAMGHRRLTITPDKWEITGGVEDQAYRWDQIVDVGVTEEHVFLFVDDGTLQIVPARAFNNEWQYEELLAKIQEYQKSGSRITSPESN